MEAYCEWKDIAIYGNWILNWKLSLENEKKIEPYGLFYCRFSFTVTCMDTVENIMCSCTATTPPKWKQRMALVLPRLISERGSSLGSCLREYVLIVYILLKYTMDSSLWNSALYTNMVSFTLYDTPTRACFIAVMIYDFCY